jgi:hypothetical protein
MGYICHHTITVIASDEGHAKAAHAEACRLFEAPGVAPVSDILTSPINGYWTFLIAPDGSKEGWRDSQRGNDARAAFVSWLEGALRRSLWLEWAVTAWPEDGDPHVVEPVLQAQS